MASLGGWIGRFSGRGPEDEALRRSEALHSAIVTTALDCIITIDHEGKITEFNPAAEKTFGYRRGEVIGRSMAELIIPPRLREAHHRGFARYFATGSGPVIGKRIEMTAMRADGTEFPSELAITRVPLPGPPTFTGHIRDITERRQAQEQLRESEARFRTLAESMSAAVFLYQGTGFRYVNRAAELLTGYSREELLKMEVWDVAHPEVRAVARERALARQRGEPVPARYDLRLLTKGGEDRWADLSAATFQLEGRVAVVGTAFDITDLKRTQEAFRASEERYRVIVDTANEGIWLADGEGRIGYVNHRMAEMFGYLPGEMVGRPVFEFMDESARAEAQRRVERRKHGIAERYDFRFCRKDGSDLWAIVSSKPLLAANGDFQWSLAMIMDVTERRQVEEALKESEERTRFALEAARICMGEWNLATGQVTWSGNLEALCGVAIPSRGSVREFLELVHPEDREFVTAAARRAVETRDYHDIEFRVVQPDGTVHWTAAKGQVFFDEAGQVGRMFGAGIDVTARKRVEEELAARARQQATVAALGRRALAGADLSVLMEEAVAEVGRNLEVEYTSILELLPGGEGLLPRAGVGFSGEWVGKPPVPAGLESQAGYTLLSEKPVFVADLRTEARFTCRWLADHGVVGSLTVRIGSERSPFGVLGAHATRARVFSEDDAHFLQGVAYVLAAAIEHADAQEQLMSSRDLLRSLLSRVEDVREVERARVARELHDELGQALACLKMDLSWLLGRLREAGGWPESLVRDRTNVMFELIDGALQAVRKIASDLRPVVLDYVGLAAAISRQIMAFRSRTQLACSLTSDLEDLQLCQDRSTAVFRVFQEALSNIARHADATAVDVRLRQEAGELVLNVQDNGKGITEAEASAYESLGLWGMRERVRPLGGSLLVGPMPGGGTLVEVRMPLESSDARAAENP